MTSSATHANIQTHSQRRTLMSKNSLHSSKTNTESNKTISNLLDRPIISVKEARKLLGVQYEGQSDEWVLETIRNLRTMTDVLIESAGSSTK